MKDLFDWKRVEQEVQVITPGISSMEKREINHRCGLCKNVPWRIDTLHH